MVVSTEADAYKNPKKEKPPFVPQEKKEESEDELIPGMGTKSFEVRLFRKFKFNFFLKFFFPFFVFFFFLLRSFFHPKTDELSCGICEELVRDPVRTPCCDRSFCRECISKELLEQAEEQKCIKGQFSVYSHLDLDHLSSLI